MLRRSFVLFAAAACILAGAGAALAESARRPDGGFDPPQLDVGFTDDSGTDGGDPGIIPPPEDAALPPQDSGAGAPLPPPQDSGPPPDTGPFVRPDAEPEPRDDASEPRGDASSGELETAEPGCSCTSVHARAPSKTRGGFAGSASLIAALAAVLYAGRCRVRSSPASSSGPSRASRPRRR